MLGGVLCKLIFGSEPFLQRKSHGDHGGETEVLNFPFESSNGASVHSEALLRMPTCYRAQEQVTNKRKTTSCPDAYTRLTSARLSHRVSHVTSQGLTVSSWDSFGSGITVSLTHGADIPFVKLQMKLKGAEMQPLLILFVPQVQVPPSGPTPCVNVAPHSVLLICWDTSSSA